MALYCQAIYLRDLHSVPRGGKKINVHNGRDFLLKLEVVKAFMDCKICLKTWKIQKNKVSPAPNVEMVERGSEKVVHKQTPIARMWSRNTQLRIVYKQ